MSRVRGKDTEPERFVRRLLHQLGYRFRLHRRDLPGRPDIVLPLHRAVILVHGCFWHQHPGCSKATVPKTNSESWETKLNRNVGRDKENIAALRKAGWKVATVWECELTDSKALLSRLSEVLPDLRRRSEHLQALASKLAGVIEGTNLLRAEAASSVVRVRISRQQGK